MDTNDGATGKETWMREQALKATRSKIVIIEDDELTAAVYKRLFLREEDRFICFIEKSAKTALAILRRERADALILDWDLPSISGLRMLDALRAHRATKLLPVMVVSGRAGIEDRIEALQHGANDYLSKPFDVHELLARLQVLLRRSEIPTKPRPKSAGQEPHPLK